MTNEQSLAWNAPLGAQQKPIPMPEKEVLPFKEDDNILVTVPNKDHDTIESALLGALLLDPGKVMPYCKKIGLHSDAFQDAFRRKMYQAMVKMSDNKIPIDALTVSYATKFPLDDVSSYLDKCLTPAHGGYYADQVLEHYAKRQLGTLSTRIAQWSKDNKNVFESLNKIQTQLDLIKPVDTSFEIRSLTDYAEAEIDESKTLLGNRFLCREGGMLFVGPSGVGKSSASVQQDILWALGRSAFGILPARPLKIVTIQAENDEGDLTEMARGIMEGLGLSKEDREIVRQNTIIISEKSLTGASYIDFVGSVLQKITPNILRIDPLQSCIGGDVSDPETISLFVHTGLNPLLQKFQCACILNHHTPKTTNRDSTKWKSSDWQYAGAGSAILTDWARAIIVVDPCKDNQHLFQFVAAKRGWRTDWTDKNDVQVIIKYFKHARERGIIFWEDATEAELTSDVLNPAKTSEEILDLVPMDEPIEKDKLIAQAKIIGIGMNRARKFVAELIEDGSLFLWKKDKTRHHIALARTEQPDPNLDL